MSRLDSYLAENGFVRSREKAKGLIKQGCVTIDGKVCTKPAFEVEENAEVEINDTTSDYVGRGRIKLEHAFDAFGLNVSDRICADIGASTGGFTQCMLNRGARLVYAVDVGHGQLDKSLTDDSRVVNCEGVNARFITDDFFEYKPTFMSVDLSFISLSLVVPALVQSLENDGEIAALIKPQFEAGKSALNKKGICRNKKDHVRVLTQLFDMFESLGLGILGAVPSAIKGGDGNTEYLVHLKKGAVTPCVIDIKKLCDSAFSDEEK